MDGINFTSIGVVAGADTSTAELQYSFNDVHPFTGVSYYRLRQTDYNGTSTLSQTIAVVAKDRGESAYIYPNPFIEKVSLNMSFLQQRSTIILTLINNIGQLISTEERSLNGNFAAFELNYETVPAGIYFLKAETDRSSYYFKLIKD